MSLFHHSDVSVSIPCQPKKNKKWKGDESLMDPSPFCAVEHRAIGKVSPEPRQTSES